jgi:transposase-like protein
VNTACKIEYIGRRRDGKSRFWCLEHKADATGKYGVELASCSRANISPPNPDDILELNPDDYRGGIGVWGAVPAVFSTAQHNFSDLGIHIHARPEVGEKKVIDRTYKSVKASLSKDLFDTKVVEIGEEEAVYYMVAQVMGYKMRNVICSRCNAPHLDKDFFAVNPHRRHLCANCGHHFHDSELGIGNPLMALKEFLGDVAFDRPTLRPNRPLEIDQSNYANGIELWGSNPAILWTATKVEEEGIHVHCYSDNPLEPIIDETFDSLKVDGVEIDAAQLRVLMAQLALPHLVGRVVSLVCPACRTPHLDEGKLAHTPHVSHQCKNCSKEFSTVGRLKNVVSNPMFQTLNELAVKSNLPRKSNAPTLLPEL